MVTEHKVKLMISDDEMLGKKGKKRQIDEKDDG